MWVLRSTSENSWGSRYIPLQSHCVAIYLPLAVGINHASHKGKPLLWLLVQRYKKPRMAKLHFNFQLNGSFVVSDGGNISLLRTTVSKLAEFKVAEEVKILKGIFKCNSERSCFHFHLLLPLYSAYWGHLSLSWLLKHNCISPHPFSLATGATNESAVDIPTFS